MTWAHPEFRVSAFTVTGNAAGVVAPSPSNAGGEGALEFRGVPYRDSVPVGTLVLSSGLGGVYPKGIPVGTVTGVVREQAGWERVYRLLPGRQPRLRRPRAGAGDLRAAISPGRSPATRRSEAQRLDSLERIRVADSVAQAAREAQGASHRLAGRHPPGYHHREAQANAPTDSAAPRPAAPKPPATPAARPPRQRRRPSPTPPDDPRPRQPAAARRGAGAARGAALLRAAAALGPARRAPTSCSSG